MLKEMRQSEQKVFDICDHVLFVSIGMQEIYQKKFEIKDSLLVENGFLNIELPKVDVDFEKKISTAKNEGRMLLGFFGTGSADKSLAHKDFGVLLDVLNKEGNHALSRKICLVLQGNISIPTQLPEKLLVLKFPYASNSQVRANIKEMDICFTARSDRLEAMQAMGGKVYDYVASGVPIWLIIPPNAISLLKFAQNTGKPLISDFSDVDSVENTLRKILNLWKKNELKKYGYTKEEAAEYSREKQYMKILNLLR